MYFNEFKGSKEIISIVFINDQAADGFEIIEKLIAVDELIWLADLV